MLGTDKVITCQKEEVGEALEKSSCLDHVNVQQAEMVRTFFTNSSSPTHLAVRVSGW